jgi:N-acetylneuraminate lyase
MKIMTILVISLFLTSSCVFAAHREKPFPMTLHSAYTPFGPLPEQALNVTGIPILAAHAKKLGVNTVFISGSMSEFDTMTITERKELTTAWVNAAKNENLYTIVNVGTTVKADAKILARHAKEQGANAIATLPPYYTLCPDVPTLVNWLADVSSVVPDMPLWYYHIPATTRTTFAMSELLPAAEDANLTQLTEAGGIKYVSTDLRDFLKTNNWVSGLNDGFRRNTTILFAPEPKLQAFAMQSPYAGAVLAEDFYAPTYLRMRAAFDKGDMQAAIEEQNWKFATDAIFSAFGGTAAKRVSYFKSCGVWMGDNRSPGKPFNMSLYFDLIKNLTAVDFWEQKKPSNLSVDSKL